MDDAPDARRPGDRRVDKGFNAFYEATTRLMAEVTQDLTRAYPERHMWRKLRALHLMLNSVADDRFDKAWKAVDVEVCCLSEGHVFNLEDLRCVHDRTGEPCPHTWLRRTSRNGARFTLDELRVRTDALVGLATRVGVGWPLSKFRDADDMSFSDGTRLGDVLARFDEDEVPGEEPA